MKMKLFLFLGIFLSITSVLTLFPISVHAAGEKYSWVDAETIEGSGGAYTTNIKQSTNKAAGTVTFKREGSTSTYRAVGDFFVTNTAGGSGERTVNCDLQLALLIIDPTSTTVQANDPDDTRPCETPLDETSTLANPDKAPEGIGTGSVTPEDESEPASTCKIDGIGWILCPVIRIMANLVDGAYAFVSSLLVVQPLIVEAGGANESIYSAWSVMRNFANIAFVITFLIIVFSQLSSVGLNNYGIKKMLPRLIVAAILVNVSFWICALAVDISNILGASLNGLFQGIPISGEPNTPTIATGEGWSGISGLVLAGTGITMLVLYSTLSALIPALLAALVAIITVFLVLTLRQALIILLVVVAPLAFVAYLLPNTESLFKKWMGLFKTLLLMYPIIALIFGASALASKVVVNSVDPDNDYKIAIQIMGALIAIIPLALTPIIMKTAGGLLNRFGGIVNNPNKGPIDKIRKRGEAYRDRRQAIATTRRLNGTNMFADSSERLKGSSNRFKRGIGRAVGGAANSTLGRNASELSSDLARSEYATELKNENAKKALAETKQEYVATNVKADPQFAQSIAGPTGNVAKLDAAAVTALKNAIAEDIGNVQKSTEVKPGKEGMEEVGQKFANAVRDGDSITARAMQNIMLTSGSVGLAQYRKTMSSDDVENNLDSNSEIGLDLRKNMLTNHSGVKATANDLMAQAINGEKMTKVSMEAKTWDLSDADLVGQKTASLEKALEAKAISSEQAARIISNEELAKYLDQSVRVEFEKVASRTAPSSPPAATTPGYTPPNNGSPATSRTSPPAGSSGFPDKPSDNGLYIPKDK